MLASELLNRRVPALSPETTLEEATQQFLDWCLCHLPVVNEKQEVLGTLSLETVQEAEDLTKTIAQVQDQLSHQQVHENFHGLHVLQAVAMHELTNIPVVDNEEKYAGSIMTSDLLGIIGTFYSFKQPGGIIVLQVGVRDYHLGEIARIVESNNAQILLLYMAEDLPNDSFKVTLKVDTLDLNPILATFQRFQYKIDFSYPPSHDEEDLRGRYELLMKLFDL